VVEVEMVVDVVLVDVVDVVLVDVVVVDGTVVDVVVVVDVEVVVVVGSMTWNVARSTTRGPVPWSQKATTTWLPTADPGGTVTVACRVSTAIPAWRPKSADGESHRTNQSVVQLT